MGLPVDKNGLTLGILLCILAVASSNNYDDRSNSASFYCSDLSAQSHIDIDHIMGMWYGAEVLDHSSDQISDLQYNSCVVIHLSEVTQEISTTEHNRQDGYGYNQNRNRNHSNMMRYLKLIWDEKGTTLDYLLRFNTTRRGFWISSGPQQGNMLELPYNQFSGTIQVMKAVGNHLVLTFCQRLPASQLFSVILARQPQSLTMDEIQSIKNLLKRRGLSVSNVRKVCRNSSVWAKPSSLLAVLSIFSLAFLLQKH